MSHQKLKLAVICGGPSPERGISLNSARSLLDHLGSEDIQIVPFYVDLHKNFYAISPAQLYSNTPSDFDFKLAQTARVLKEQDFVAELKKTDLVFPAIHGAFGEDGQLQALLEAHDIPFIGSPAGACVAMFNKYQAGKVLRENGFYTLPVLQVSQDDKNIEEKVAAFFVAQKLKRAVVKPAAGGSSIGVSSVATPDEAFSKIQSLFAKNIDSQVLVEPFCEGREFTVIVLQNPQGQPVAFVPTEIELNYDDHQIFDFRRKYLPTRQVIYHCPPRFETPVIHKIQSEAEKIFALFGMRDFIRLDGWVLPDGQVWFSDINPISGMEQNSFLFQQGARLGLTHRQMLLAIIRNACRRIGITPPEPHEKSGQRQKVRVIFGGNTAERQVSLMSGTNVWLKLRQSTRYAPEPYLLDIEGNLWQLPYSYTLHHTVEEIFDHCVEAAEIHRVLAPLAAEVRRKLALPESAYLQESDMPRKLDWASFLTDKSFVFLGLHGGAGEDGTIARQLAEHGIAYNGSDYEGAQLCMDKSRTGEIITGLGHAKIHSALKKTVWAADFKGFGKSDFAEYWQKLTQDLKATHLIIKPRGDGCSAGVVRLNAPENLALYMKLLADGAAFIPSGSFPQQDSIVEMPGSPDTAFLIENFIETDYIRIVGNRLEYRPQTGWVELTGGVLEQDGHYHALNPSITIAEGAVLSLEEKFQGGTGINLTPPPVDIVAPALLAQVRHYVEIAAAALKIRNYSRIDFFLNVQTGDVVIIEANTLPGLTPSTVIFHQALTETPPVEPREFLEKIIDLKLGRQEMAAA